jgi:hypothetical protein
VIVGYRSPEQSVADKHDARREVCGASGPVVVVGTTASQVPFSPHPCPKQSAIAYGLGVLRKMNTRNCNNVSLYTFHT